MIQAVLWKTDIFLPYHKPKSRLAFFIGADLRAVYIVVKSFQVFVFIPEIVFNQVKSENFIFAGNDF